MIRVDVVNPALARNVHRRRVQVAAPARSREPVSASSTQYRLEAYAASGTGPNGPLAAPKEATYLSDRRALHLQYVQNLP